MIQLGENKKNTWDLACRCSSFGKSVEWDIYSKSGRSYKQQISKSWWLLNPLLLRVVGVLI